MITITKKMYFLFGSILLLALAFTSCSKENIQPNQDTELTEDIQSIADESELAQNESAATRAAAWQWNWIPMNKTNYTPDNSGIPNYSGKYYNFWGDGGWAKVKVNSGGNFELEFKNNRDVVGGKGWRTGSTSRRINYNIGYQAGQYAFTGVYGWVKKGGRIIEYYVNERKNGSGGGTITGTNQNKDFGTDNKYYRFKKRNRNAPNAYGGGSAPFTQFISENKGNVSKGNNHRISMNRHFQQWGWDGGIGGGWNSHLYQVFGTENFNGGWGKINCSVW